MEGFGALEMYLLLCFVQLPKHCRLAVHHCHGHVRSAAGTIQGADGDEEDQQDRRA